MNKTSTKIILALGLLMLFGMSSAVQAELSLDKRLSFSFAGGGRQPVWNGTSQIWAISSAYAFSLGYGLTEETMLFLDWERSKVYDDTASGKIVKLGKENASQYWKNNTWRLRMKYYMLGNSSFVPYLSGAVGLAFWSVHDYSSGDILRVPDADGEIVDYEATEFLISTGVGYEWFLSDHLSFNLDLHLNYLTLYGTHLSDTANDVRSRGYFDLKAGFSFYFDFSKSRRHFDHDLLSPSHNVEDYDMTDSDLDGIPDYLDFCPESPPEAIGYTDDTGCPLDSDEDGLPDYLDRCPFVYYKSESEHDGCPPDSDGDGVVDAEDACPDNPEGYVVDEWGCPIKSEIFARRTLQVRFSESGEYIDFVSRRYLDSLALALKQFPEVSCEIRGYTENLDDLEYSRNLSLQEAEKVRDYLVRRRVTRDRIKIYGVGAERFISTNSTREGRESNHRIEIVFDY